MTITFVLGRGRTGFAQTVIRGGVYLHKFSTKDPIDALDRGGSRSQYANLKVDLPTQLSGTSRHHGVRSSNYQQ